MVWVASVWTEAHREWRDVRGRPLGEVNSEAYATTAQDETACPYPDHRASYAHPMNNAALEQAVAVWPEVVRHTRWVAARRSTGRSPTIVEAWLAATECKWLALAQRAATREIPDAHAALYKTMLGYSRIFMVLALLTPTQREAPLSAWLPADAFWRFIDDGHWLVGQRQVCAGSAAHVVGGYRALTEPGPGGAPLAVPAGYLAQLERAQALELLLFYAAARVREVLLAGGIDEVPGYGSPSPDHARWPEVARFALTSGHRVAALMRSLPTATTATVLDVWTATGIPIPPLLRGDPASLRALDEAVRLGALG